VDSMENANRRIFRECCKIHSSASSIKSFKRFFPAVINVYVAATFSATVAFSAVHVAMSLNVRYAWIDSLRIFICQH